MVVCDYNRYTSAPVAHLEAHKTKKIIGQMDTAATLSYFTVPLDAISEVLASLKHMHGDVSLHDACSFGELTFDYLIERERVDITHIQEGGAIVVAVKSDTNISYNIGYLE